MLNVLFNLLMSYLDSSSKIQTPVAHIGNFVGDLTERGRSLIVAGVLWLVAGLLVFSSLVIFCVELGLQIDRGHFFSITGLVISSLILFSMAFVLFVAGLIISKRKKEKELPPPKLDPADELKRALFDVAISFVQEFKSNRTRPESSKD